MLCPFICMWAFRLLPHLGYVNNSTVNVGVQMSLWDSAFSSCGHTLRIDIAGFYGSYILNFLRNCSALCQQLHSFTVLPTVCKSSCFSISSSELLFSVLGFFWYFCLFLESCILLFMRWYVIVGYLQGCFPDDKWCWASFHAYWPFVYILWINVYSSPWPIF